jgi:hypothetical protein
MSNAETVAAVYDRRNQIGANRASIQIEILLDDLEDRPLTVTRGGTREQRANGVNGLTAATDDATDISSSKLQLKDGCSAAWNFREDHVIGKFNQLSNDELEKLSHAAERLITNPPSHNSYGVTDGVESPSSMPHCCKVHCPADHMTDRCAEDSALYGTGNKLASLTFRPEAREVMAGPLRIAALFAQLWLPAPWSLWPSYFS